jgi:hypothetical protein
MANAQTILADYERKLELARAELWKSQRALDECRKAVDVAKAACDAAKEIWAATEQPVKQKRGTFRRQRSLTENWQRLLAFVHQEGATFGYEALEWAADGLDIEVSKETMRSQMSNYKAAGLVDAPAPGEFRLTVAGIKAAKIDKQKKAAFDPLGPEAIEEFGRVAELGGPEKSGQRAFPSAENVTSSPTPPPPAPFGGFVDDLDDDIPF